MAQRGPEQNRAEQQEGDRVQKTAGLVEQEGVRSLAAPGSPPNTIPPTNAAMNPEPPSGFAIPYASPAAATGTICSQDSEISLRRPAKTTIAASIRPASTPPRIP